MPFVPSRNPFASDALYEFKIDTNGDAVADIAYSVRFSPFAGGAQTATLRRVEGAQAAGTSDGGQIIVKEAPVSLDGKAQITEAGGHRFFVGWRSEPFFFDVIGALNNFQFTGKDFFVDKDVCSIVLEVPNSALGPNAVMGHKRRFLSAISPHRDFASPRFRLTAISPQRDFDVRFGCFRGLVALLGRDTGSRGTADAAWST
jgi:hypothetical protein